MNGITPKYPNNRLNTNGNTVFTTRASEHDNIKRIATIAENFKQVFLPVSINDTNQIFLKKAVKVFNLK